MSLSPTAHRRSHRGPVTMLTAGLIESSESDIRLRGTTGVSVSLDETPDLSKAPFAASAVPDNQADNNLPDRQRFPSSASTVTKNGDPLRKALENVVLTIHQRVQRTEEMTRNNRYSFISDRADALYGLAANERTNVVSPPSYRPLFPPTPRVSSLPLPPTPSAGSEQKAAKYRSIFHHDSHTENSDELLQRIPRRSSSGQVQVKDSGNVKDAVQVIPVTTASKPTLGSQGPENSLPLSKQIYRKARSREVRLVLGELSAEFAPTIDQVDGIYEMMWECETPLTKEYYAKMESAVNFIRGVESYYRFPRLSYLEPQALEETNTGDSSTYSRSTAATATTGTMPPLPDLLEILQVFKSFDATTPPAHMPLNTRNLKTYHHISETRKDPGYAAAVRMAKSQLLEQRLQQSPPRRVLVQAPSSAKRAMPFTPAGTPRVSPVPLGDGLLSAIPSTPRKRKLLAQNAAEAKKPKTPRKTPTGRAAKSVPLNSSKIPKRNADIVSQESSAADRLLEFFTILSSENQELMLKAIQQNEIASSVNNVDASVAVTPHAQMSVCESQIFTELDTMSGGSGWDMDPFSGSVFPTKDTSLAPFSMPMNMSDLMVGGGVAGSILDNEGMDWLANLTQFSSPAGFEDMSNNNNNATVGVISNETVNAIDGDLSTFYNEFLDISGLEQGCGSIMDNLL